MSTRSHIARLNRDGSVDSVYCHWDGYPEYNGVMLRDYHSNQEDVDHIIELGSMSVLDKLLDPTANYHSFDTPETNVSIFYGRDRGELGVGAEHFDTQVEWEQIISCGFMAIEYGYIWDGDKWNCYRGYSKEYIEIPA